MNLRDQLIESGLHEKPATWIAENIDTAKYALSVEKVPFPRLRLSDEQKQMILDAPDNEPVVMPFGKYKGQAIVEVADNDPGYLIWAIRNVDAQTTKMIEDELSKASILKSDEKYRQIIHRAYGYE